MADQRTTNIEARTYGNLARTHLVEFHRYLAFHPADAGLSIAHYFFNSPGTIQFRQSHQIPSLHQGPLSPC
jgi:hypothetical protein